MTSDVEKVGFRPLTGEQRYRQAVQKARIKSRRLLRQFLNDEIPILPCSGDIEREAIVAELDRVARSALGGK